MGMLEAGSQWLSGQIATCLFNTVNYRRGSDTITGLVASRQKTTYEVIDLNGLVVKIESHDFVVKSASLLVNSLKILPIAGDKIEVTANGQTLVFEVMALGQQANDVPYRFCDPWGHQFRIFTKQKEPKI